MADCVVSTYHVPVVEIDNAIFHQGQVYLNYHQQDEEVSRDDYLCMSVSAPVPKQWMLRQSLRVAREMSTFFAATRNSLQSSLVVQSDKIEWIPGPQLHMKSIPNSNASSSSRQPTVCRRLEHAVSCVLGYFHSP